ncbi:MAG TPA: hypothetical protein VGF79_03810, partial [Bacteroidia bacterium]
METLFLRLYKVENLAAEIGSRFHIKFSGVPFAEGDRQFSFGVTNGQYLEFNRYLFAHDVVASPSNLTINIEIRSATLLVPFTVNRIINYLGNDDGTFIVDIVPPGYPITSKVKLYFAYYSRTKVTTTDYYADLYNLSDCLRRLMMWESYIEGNALLSGSYNDLKDKLEQLMEKLNNISQGFDYGNLLYNDNASLADNFNAFLLRLNSIKNHLSWEKNYTKMNQFDVAFDNFVNEFNQFKSDMNANGINPCETGIIHDVWGDIDDDYKSRLKCFCKIFALDGSLPTSLQAVLNVLKTKIDGLRTDLYNFQTAQGSASQNPAKENYNAISYYNQFSSGVSYCDKANEVFELLQWVNNNRQYLIDISPNTVQQFIDDLSSDLRSLKSIFDELEFGLPGVCKEIDTGFDWGNSIVQSAYMYLQACGADATDPFTEGVHLRWSLLKELGENHIPKGNLANTSTSNYADFGYTKDNDYVELYKTAYSNKAIISIDLAIVNPKFEQFDATDNSYTWTFPVDSTTSGTGRQFKNDVLFKFSEKAVYDAIRISNNPLTNALNFLKAYGGVVEVKVDKKLMFAYKFEIANQVPMGMGNFSHEVINLPDVSDETSKRITRRNISSGTAFNVEDLGENISSLRFRTAMNAYLSKIHLETYFDFLSTRASTDWTDLGDFGLTETDSEAYSRLDGGGSYNINNEWPKFTDDVKIKIQNYKDRWADSTQGLKKSVSDYLNLSKTNLKADFEFESEMDGDSAVMPFSYLDILQLNALDFHNARMLGLGHIDTASITQKFVYMVRYKTNPLLKDNRNAPLYDHFFMSLPTDKTDLRLPLKPEVDVSYGLKGMDECLLNKLQKTGGYARYDNIRFINVHREKYDYEIGFESFFQSAQQFDIAELALPVFYGVKYRDYGGSYQKPDLTHDTEFLDYNGSGSPSEVYETAPVIDTLDKLHTHFEDEEGVHQYAIYGVNWFSRASAVSEPFTTDTTLFNNNAKVLPPANIQAHYIQKENTLIFTTEAEQIALANRNTADPDGDNCQTRLTFNWGYQQHFSYPDCNLLEFFFRENLPMTVEGKINKITSSGNGLFELHCQSYQIVSQKEIEIVTPTLSMTDYAKFIGGRLISDGGVYTITSIQSLSGVTIVQFKAESAQVAQLDSSGGNFTAFCSPLIPKAGRLFQIIENLADESNWKKLTRTVSIVKHSDDSIVVDGEERKYGGINGDVNVYADTYLNTPNGIPGLFKIQYTLKTLADHPQKAQGVHWNKGTVLLKDQDDVYRELEVWGIESQSPLVIWAYDGQYNPSNYDYELSEASPVNSNSVFHPGYKVYLSAESANDFDRDHIMPLGAEYKKATLMAIRSVNTAPTPDIVSRISQSVPLMAYMKRDPVKPNQPEGARFATRPDVYAQSTYTFDLQLEDEKPFSLMCYKSTELSLLTAVYDTVTIVGVYNSLAELEDTSGEYQRFNDFVNAVFDVEDDENDKKQFKEYGGYRLPNTFKTEIEEGDSEELPDRFLQAINLTFVGMTPNPIVYSKVKIDNDFRLTKAGPPVLKDENGEDLPEDDPNYDQYPFAVCFSEGGQDYIRFTDYRLSGASSDKYFYVIAEISIEQEIGERSEAIGPVRTINSMPAEAPYIKKYESVLAYPTLEISAGVRFYLNPYLDSEDVEKIAIYRTLELKNSDDLQLMTLANTSFVNSTNEVVDSFEDIDFPPFGYDIYYRLVALRKIINEYDEVEYIPSKASEKIICKVIDNVNPPSPEITYTVARIFSEPGRLEDITLQWDASCFEGKYTLYKMSDTGFWQKISSYNYSDVFQYNMAYLNTEDDDGDVVYHRFKVVAENKNGLLSLDEKIATLWQIPDWFKKLPLSKYN